VDLKIEVDVQSISLGVIRLSGIRILPVSEELKHRIDNKIGEMNKTPAANEEMSKKLVRSLLRFGRYKPSGRGKPASEYLLESAREGSFPSINNLVDALNLVSMGSLLPISLIDMDKAGSRVFRLRRGRKEESYIFNRSGQTLDLEDLLLVSVLPEDLPAATPVKDSQRTKVDENTKEALAVVYSPPELKENLIRAVDDLAGEFAGFAITEAEIIGRQ
jgi:DNA/RNA-binding domain of Phe-tRNA-synthetase-like protein